MNFDSDELENVNRRLLFLEILTQKEKIAGELYRGLYRETLQKLDATLIPDAVEQQLDVIIDAKMREWICATADNDMQMASILSALYNDLDEKSKEPPGTSSQAAI